MPLSLNEREQARTLLSMNTLCIDVGNTSTHYGLVSGQTVTNTGHFPTKAFIESPSAAFNEQVAPLAEQIQGIYFCSVVPEINNNLLASLLHFVLPTFHLTCEN